MADFTYPQAMVEGLSGTTILSRLDANLGDSVGGKTGSLQQWLAADPTSATAPNLDRTNFSAYADLRTVQITAGALISTSFALDTAHRALDTRGLASGSVSNTALTPSAVTQRVLAVGRKGGDCKVMQTDKPQIGMLRGHGLVTIGVGESASTTAISWTAGTPTACETRPVSWTATLTNTHVIACLTHESGEGAPITPTAGGAGLTLAAIGESTFTIRASLYDSTGAISPSGAIMPINFEWRGFMRWGA